jgi:thiamine monophosphate kinase
MSDGLLAAAEQLGQPNNLLFRLSPTLIPYASSPKDTESESRWRNVVSNVGGDFGLMLTAPPDKQALAEAMGAHAVGEVVTSDMIGVCRSNFEAVGITVRPWEQFRTIGGISDEIRAFV